MKILGQEDAIEARRVSWLGGQALQVCSPSRTVSCSREIKPGETFGKLFDDDLGRLLTTAARFTKTPLVLRPGLKGQHVELFGYCLEKAIAAAKVDEDVFKPLSLEAMISEQ